MYMNKLAQTNYTHNLPLFLLINNNDDKMIYFKKNIQYSIYTRRRNKTYTHTENIYT